MKFFLVGIGQLGCIPNQLASGLAPPGKCVSNVNDMVGLFNIRLRSLVDQLKKSHHDAIFVYGNTFGAFGDILTNATAYGKNIIFKYYICFTKNKKSHFNFKKLKLPL